MNRYRSYSTEEVKALHEKLNLYKETLYTLKSKSVIDDYLLTKHESDGFKINLEGVMKRMEEYHYGVEQKTKELSAQVQSVNETVSVLKKDIDFIKEKMDRLQVHDLVTKMNRIIDTQEKPAKQETFEVDQLKEEITQLKQQIHNTQQTSQLTEDSYHKHVEQNVPQRSSEYRRLQNMLQSSRSFTSGRNDYYPPMSQTPSYNNHQPSFQQNPPKPSTSKVSKGRGPGGKKRTYVNPQMDNSQNTIIRSKSKKNAEESAQQGINDEENQKKRIEFQTEKSKHPTIDADLGQQENLQSREEKEIEPSHLQQENQESMVFENERDSTPREMVDQKPDTEPTSEKREETPKDSSNLPALEKVPPAMPVHDHDSSKKGHEAKIDQEKVSSSAVPDDETTEEENEDMEKGKKIEFSSLFSIFQKRN